MAAYTGALAVQLLSEDRWGHFASDERKESGSLLSIDKSHGGTYSLRLRSGGTHEVFFGTDAGSKTITVWAWPSLGGACVMRLTDRTTQRSVLASAVSVGTGDWEQLSIVHTMVKGVYIIRLENQAKNDGDMRAYFDDLEVA